ncbi:Holin family protein [compost metagenome]
MILCTYFAPIKAILVITGITIAADFISGVWVAFKIGEGWIGCKAWRTVNKALCAFGAIMLFYGYERVFQIELFSPAKSISAIICAFETWSILENFAKITNHPMFNFIKKLMNDRIEKEFGQKLEVNDERD